MSSASRSKLVLPFPELCRRELHLESTLQELPLYDFQVESHHPSQEVAQTFQQNPLLPGVILTEDKHFLGMLSRRRFLEQMSRPYGLDLFLKRPLKALYRFVSADILVFPGDTLIVEAARQALLRSPEALYEPVVVQQSDAPAYQLLDVHQLLVAQSQIHELATQLLNQLYQQLATANQELQKLATLDGLTQVANRRRFDDYLQQTWWRLMPEQQPLALILCDIDCFKAYNDNYRHLMGDHCLQQVAIAMSQAVHRSSDLVARYGGEEFAVILPNTDIEAAVQVAQHIQSAVRELEIVHQHSGANGFITLSLGVASTLPTPSSSPEQLILAADKSLYQAKQNGRDRIICHCDFIEQDVEISRAI